jgi:ABC-type uncharacterized transport system substrate-binding protein
VSADRERYPQAAPPGAGATTAGGRGLRAALLALVVALAPGPARAHPHVFIDGGVDFLFDAEGRLTDLRVSWIYDPLTSLLMLEDLGIDAYGAAPLAPADRAALAAYQTDWYPEFEGDSYLWDGDRRIGLSRPRAADAEVVDGRVVIRFERALDAPFRPGAETVVKVYDPTYFTAYSITERPRLEGGAARCGARVQPFEPSGPLAALQRSLSAIGIDEDPEEDVGAVFAERVFVTCV